MADEGIYVRVLGDYGPFSSMGKSIGYLVSIGESSFLVDCGSPLFQQIGGHGLKSVKGLIVTHCHDDHKRWLTDLALFSLYAPDHRHKLSIFTSEVINENLSIASGPALDTSLSGDSKKVVDLGYDDYINFTPLGPRAKFRIIRRENGEAVSRLEIVDLNGDTVGPDRAKIVISSRNGKPRLLFKDPDYGEWVEPGLFYPFSSTTYYEENRNIYRDPSGFTIEAINAPVWHGVPSIGLRFSTPTESLVFSADTAHNTELWQTLHSEKRSQNLNVSVDEFNRVSVISGDINDYIERLWSRERYQEALTAFDDAIVIHDIATRKSVVHTDYRSLHHTVLKKEKVILTHSPDKMTSEWSLSKSEKTFLIRGMNFHEVVGDRLCRMDAAVYHKEKGKYFVGYKNPKGRVTVYENDGILNLGGQWNWENGAELFKVDLYEDIGGQYLPKLADDDNSRYVERVDGRIELVTFSEHGSRGTIAEDQRSRLSMTLSPDTPSFLVLGIGNLVMSDDGIGVRVVQKLQASYSFPDNVKVVDGGTLGLDLLPMLENITHLILVDAVETGGIPGTCVRLSGEELPIALETKLSPHQMGLKDLLAVSELMGHSPREMVLFGVQPGCIEMDTELTPAVEAQLETLVASVLSEFKGWGVRISLV
ncbi:MAG: hydrogenase maturation protease [Deltaproteobacteria bacterium]